MAYISSTSAVLYNQGVVWVAPKVCTSSPMHHRPLLALPRPHARVAGLSSEGSSARLMLPLLFPGLTVGLVVPLAPARPVTALAGLSLPQARGGSSVELGAAVAASTASRKTLLVLGTYPGDFNMIEYGQRLRHHLPGLRAKGVERFLVVVNGEKNACERLAELLDLPEEVELLSDPTGEAGRRFGVSRGWLPDDNRLSPFLKLYIMLFGVGPPATCAATCHPRSSARPVAFLPHPRRAGCPP